MKCCSVLHVWRLLLTCGVQCVVLVVVVMAASPSFFISSQNVAIYQSSMEKFEEVSVECSSGVVRVWPCLTWWYLCVEDKGTW